MKFGYLVFGVGLNVLSTKPTTKFKVVGLVY